MWDTFLNRELLDFFKILKLNLETAFQPIAESEGLTVMQVRILIEIQNSDIATVGSLSRLMGENHGNCSSLCKKMEQAGFVNRIRSKSDERIVTLRLTPKGTSAVEAVNRQMDERFRPVLEATSPEQLEQMRLGMQAISDLLNRFAAMPKEG